MKFNISYPANGTNTLIEIDDEKKVRNVYEKQMGAVFEGELLGEEYAGYEFKITGGNDKQGFPMMQGILVPGRVRLLMKKGFKTFKPRRTGYRRRKSVRGCIVSAEIGVLFLAVVKEGDNPIAGLTDHSVPRRLGPKRANNIRKLFKLSKEDDVRKYVVRREVPAKGPRNKPRSKAPKIQRLITPQRLQRQRKRLQLKKRRYAKNIKEAADYKVVVAQRLEEAKAKRAEAVAKARAKRVASAASS
eukprot:TRINITY_DN1880_c0_g1_i1.p1 TRINITY_DN1880_c0_g1~~TRINITY_DN1880_c0_g1_i1.p1  ORF type:complete len:262 (+),score=71.67 TRINITY_DN1880_c0_g1_i1:52-786(+)